MEYLWKRTRPSTVIIVVGSHQVWTAEKLEKKWEVYYNIFCLYFEFSLRLLTTLRILCFVSIRLSKSLMRFLTSSLFFFLYSKYEIQLLSMQPSQFGSLQLKDKRKTDRVVVIMSPYHISLKMSVMLLETISSLSFSLCRRFICKYTKWQ